MHSKDRYGDSPGSILCTFQQVLGRFLQELDSHVLVYEKAIGQPNVKKLLNGVH